METDNIEKQLQIAKLISDSLQRNLTTEEQLKLNSWLDEDKSNRNLFSQIIDKKNTATFIKEIKNINVAEAKLNIYKKVKYRKLKKVLISSLKYAALLVIIMGSSYFLMQIQKDGQSSELNINEEIITLRLENGEIKTIDPGRNSNVTDKKGRIIGVQSGSNLKYSSNNTSVEPIAYNELNIPYGKKFQLELSDGTLVHLNSGSSLRYPVKFLSGHERIVSIKGEAYFEVAEDKTSPFIVQSNNVNIRVLGTKFNVSSYEEDNLLNTVLVEGSVSLFLHGEEYSESNSTLLNPGQLASWDKSNNQFSFNEVDTHIYTAWTKGKLVFKNTPFSSIRKKLERHYNVTIINNNKLLDGKMYNATFDIETIEQVMKSFNENFSINYSVIKNQIIIN